MKAVLPDGEKRAGRLLSCHEHNAEARSAQLVAAMCDQGQSVALVSDAGTPGVSDPGLVVVRAAAAAGAPVSAVPGACAALAALVVSGLPLHAFTFVGFLPRSGGARTSALERIARASHTVAIYEAPLRVRATLANLAVAVDGQLSDRPLCVARELTKKYETVTRFTSVTAAAAHYAKTEGEPRGEHVLVLGPPPTSLVPTSDSEIASATIDVKAIALALLKEGVPVKTIAKSLSSVSPMQKKTLYSFVQVLKEQICSARS